MKKTFLALTFLLSFLVPSSWALEPQAGLSGEQIKILEVCTTCIENMPEHELEKLVTFAQEIDLESMLQNNKAFISQDWINRHLYNTTLYNATEIIKWVIEEAIIDFSYTSVIFAMFGVTSVLAFYLLCKAYQHMKVFNDQNQQEKYGILNETGEKS